MAVVFQSDPSHAGRWFVSQSEHDEPQIGAQFVTTPKDELTVYWHGRVGRIHLIKIVDEARQVLVREGRLTEATLIAYGKNLREEITFTKDAIPTRPKPSSALATFDACRAELTCAAGRVVVWANVTGKPMVALNSGGENIGVSVTPGLFEGPVRPVISHAIESTMHLQSDTVATLLNTISDQLIPKFRPMVG